MLSYHCEHCVFVCTCTQTQCPADRASLELHMHYNHERVLLCWARLQGNDKIHVVCNNVYIIMLSKVGSSFCVS